MARFKRLEVLNAMAETSLIPVFYNADMETAKNIVTACVDGGARVVEFVNRGDQAHLVFTELPTASVFSPRRVTSAWSSRSMWRKKLNVLFQAAVSAR